MAEKATTAPPLTVEKVCEAVQGVEWTVLGLFIPISKRREIEQLQDTSNEKCLQAVVECWLGGGEDEGQEPSWRRLIWTLDAKDETKVADKIRHFAEPVLDPTLTVENVMEVMGEVENWEAVARGSDILRHGLGIPYSKQQQIKKQSSSEREKSHSLGEYWVNTDPDASWVELGRALYKEGEERAAVMVKHYLLEDPTLTVENVAKVMEEVRDWLGVGYTLQVPYSKVKQIKQQSSSERDKSCSLGRYWVNADPETSWIKLSRILYKKEEMGALEIVERYLPKADPTLTTDNLMEVVKGVEDHWNNLSRRLRVPRSKRLEIRRNYQSNCQRMGALVDYYMGSPTKSWKAIARALQLIKLPKQADEVTTRYIQGVEGLSLSTHSDESSWQFPQAAAMDRGLIQRHIEQQGSLMMNSHKLLLCGLPRTGKTTAMRRLSNQLWCLNPNESPVPSTGFEKPVTVELYQRTVKQSVVIAGVGRKVEWEYQNLEQQGQTLCSRILKSSTKSTPSPVMTSSSSQSDVASSSGTQEQTLPISREDEDLLPSQSSAELYQLQDVLTSLVKEQDWRAVREKLKAIEDVTILHMIDCGGHPECHEILPLLLEGRALSLLFLNLTHDLDKAYHVMFQGKEGPSSIEYESVFTTREVLQCILCGISSLQSGDHEERPVALLVGSYLDKTNNEAVLTLDKSVQEALKSFIKQDILFPANVKEGNYIATLDNMSEDQGDVEELRKIILAIIETRFHAEPIPTAWLMLHLLLRARYEKEPGWCTVKECVKVARACGIKEELLGVDGILRYIHKHYGTLLYYPKVPGLCDRVICDPNIILHPFTQTFLIAFACNQGHFKTAKLIRATGEIPHDLMETVSATKSTEPIPTSEIIALFKDRYILYENVCTVAGTRSYFMPCLLQPDHSVVKEASNPTTLSSLNPAPLQLVPHSSGYVPLGLFPALVVKMSDTWDLKSGERFRNRIQFKVRQEGKQTRRIELRQHPSYLELRLLDKEQQQGMDLSILSTCRQQLGEALHEVSSQYPHMKDVVWRYGFYCPGGLKPGGHPHSAVCPTKVEKTCPRKEVAPVDMECIHDPCCEEEDFLLEAKHINWFKDQDQDQAGGLDPPPATDYDVAPPSKQPRGQTEVMANERPDLLKLLNFPGKSGNISIPQQVGAKYFMFGVVLLNDKTGAEVSAIATQYRGDAEQIIFEILRLWIGGKGKPLSWDALINVLKAIELNILAGDIQDSL